MFFLTSASLASLTGKRWMMAVDFTASALTRLEWARRGRSLNSKRPTSRSAAAVRGYDVSPDGQRFYAIQIRERLAPPRVTVIDLALNWFEELKAKVPIK